MSHTYHSLSLKFNIQFQSQLQWGDWINFSVPTLLFGSNNNNNNNLNNGTITKIFVIEPISVVYLFDCPAWTWTLMNLGFHWLSHNNIYINIEFLHLNFIFEIHQIHKIQTKTNKNIVARSIKVILGSRLFLDVSLHRSLIILNLTDHWSSVHRTIFQILVLFI